MIMSKIIYFIIVIVSLMLLVGCGSRNDTESQPADGSLADEYHGYELLPYEEPAPISEQTTVYLLSEFNVNLLEQSGISEYGLQVAADFLSEFTSILAGMASFGFVPGEVFVIGFDDETQKFITTHETPEIYFAYMGDGLFAFFDRQGNIINDSPSVIITSWEDNDDQQGMLFYHFANSFKLYNFDNDGIPDIFVYFATTGTPPMDSFYAIFRYINGEYKMLTVREFVDGEELSPWWRTRTWPWLNTEHKLFLDEDGRIITFIYSHQQGLMQYGHLIFMDNYADLHIIVDFSDKYRESDDYRNAWQAHHWGEWFEDDRWINHSPTIFGTDISIEPIVPLEALSAALIEYLQR